MSKRTCKAAALHILRTFVIEMLQISEKCAIMLIDQLEFMNIGVIVNMSDIKRLFSDDIVTHCEQCSGAVQYKGSGRYVCEECGAEYLNDFGKVKKYINDHGPSNAVTISEGTGVSRRKIQDFLKEGRVEVVEDAAAGVTFCLMCGLPIRSGQYCKTCLDRIGKSTPDKMSGYSIKSEEELKKHRGQRRFDTRVD